MNPVIGHDGCKNKCGKRQFTATPTWVRSPRSDRWGRRSGGNARKGADFEGPVLEDGSGAPTVRRAQLGTAPTGISVGAPAGDWLMTSEALPATPTALTLRTSEAGGKPALRGQRQAAPRSDTNAGKFWTTWLFGVCLMGFSGGKRRGSEHEHCIKGF
jgi:hypothetical protein